MIAFLTSSFVTYSPDHNYRPEAVNPSNGFVDELKKVWKNDTRFLVIPSDPSDTAMTREVCRQMKDSFTLAGLNVAEVSVYEGEDLGEVLRPDHRPTAAEAAAVPWGSAGPKLLELVRHADVIFLAGGHGPTENRFIRLCGLKEALAGFDGIFIGLSAGTVNAAAEAYLLPELEGESIDPGFGRFAEGLGLTDLQIIPHSGYMNTAAVDGKRMLEEIFIPDSAGHTFYYIPDGSYFIVRDGQAEFHGDGWRIRDGKFSRLRTGRIAVQAEEVMPEDRCTEFLSPGNNCEEAAAVRETIGAHVWDTLMQNGYDCVAEVDDRTGDVIYYYLSPLFRERGVTPGLIDAAEVPSREDRLQMSDFTRLQEQIAADVAAPEEQEDYPRHLVPDAVKSSIRESGLFAMTFHIDTEEGLQAEGIRIRPIGSTDSHRFLITFQDITSALDHDWMTDEYAHTGFLREAEKFLKTMDESRLYSLVYANVKGFKAINDLFGDQTGDIVIFQVRDALRECLHPVLIGRIEADHFVLITEHSNLSSEHLDALGSRIYTGNGKQYRYSIQCGIYPIRRSRTLHGEYPSITHMLDRAKLAEKSIPADIGTNYAIYADELRQNYINQRILLSDMKDSLETGEFMVYYQPVVDVHTETICSAEALVRWKHHDLGMISPGQFVPAFEKGGVISTLDSFVMESVMNRSAERAAAGRPTVPVAMNLSRADFYDARLLKQISDTVHKNDVLPSLVRIEVTESAYLTLERNAVDFLQEMRRLGIPILLDDYGSGMSSLSTMESFDFDVIKLDMGFIRKIGSRKAEAIIRSTIRLAHDLGSSVVAEGVETEEQRQFLIDNQCDMIQGYYYYRPMPGNEFDALLETGG